MSGYLNNVYLRIACLFVNINLSSDRELAMLRAKAALIDISGTLHVGDLAIAGAPSALEKLRAAGVAVRFVTNSSQVSRDGLVRRARAARRRSDAGSSRFRRRWAACVPWASSLTRARSGLRLARRARTLRAEGCGRSCC